ncbi:hypothetical protein IU11_07205, partial [Cellulosimicrobium sp. MM]
EGGRHAPDYVVKLLVPLPDAARLAAAAGALAVTRPGAQDAVPDAADVVALAEHAANPDRPT